MKEKKIGKISLRTGLKCGLIVILFLFTLNLLFCVKNSASTTFIPYSESNVVGDVNLTVTVSSQNLKWDDTFYLNITIINTTTQEFIPNSNVYLNISSLVEIFIIIPMSNLYYITFGLCDLPTGSINRSYSIEHVPTLNPYLLLVHYINNSQPSFNVSFFLNIESVRFPFISFFTFDNFLILYFSLLVICGLYLWYLKYRKGENNSDGKNSKLSTTIFYEKAP